MIIAVPVIRQVKLLEDYIAMLEGGTAVLHLLPVWQRFTPLFASFSGDHVICNEDVYGGTYRLLTSILNRLKIESTFVDMTRY